MSTYEYTHRQKNQAQNLAYPATLEASSAEVDVDLDRLASEIFAAMGLLLPTPEQYSLVCDVIIRSFDLFTSHYWRPEDFTEGAIACCTKSAVHLLMAAQGIDPALLDPLRRIAHADATQQVH